MAKLKTAFKLTAETPYYFVSVHGDNLFESDNINECKEFLIKYIKKHKAEVMEEPYEYYIGMYSIGTEDFD